MQDQPDLSGLAALAICESLLLALNDRNVMPESVIVDVLKVAATTLEEVVPAGGNSAAAATLIHNIINGRNSVRRP